VAGRLADTKEVIASLKESLEGSTAAGRQSLQRLLKTPIVVTRTVTDGEIVFTFKLTASFADAPLDLAVSRGGDVPDDVVEKYLADRVFTGTVTRRAWRWCPRADSKKCTRESFQVFRARRSS
jgi:hypothetical protein